MKWWGAVVSGILLFTGCERAEVPTVTVGQAEFVVEVETRGELAAVRSRTVSRPREGARQSAIVALAPEGEIVAEGDFLVQFDTADAERDLAQKEAALENARAKLQAQRAQSASRMAEIESQLLAQQYSYEQSKLRFEQMQYEAEARRREQELELRKAELSLQEARERIVSQRTVDEANLRTAQIEVQQAEVEVQRAREALQKQTLHAPIGGMVVYRTIWKSGTSGKVAVGDTPWPGQEVLEIPDLTEMMARTKVDEVDIHRVRSGQPATVVIDALDGLQLRGSVTRVATLAKQERGETTKTFDVEILIEDHDPRLRPGMTTLCRIEVERHPDALSVPLEAVFQRDGQNIVWRMQGGAEATPVELGSRNRDHVRVISGLQAGDVVALRDPTAPVREIGEPVTGQQGAPNGGQGS